MPKRILILLLSISLLLGGTGSLMAQVRMTVMEAGHAHASAMAAADADGGHCATHDGQPPGDANASGHGGDKARDKETCLQLCLQLCLHSCPAVFAASMPPPPVLIASDRRLPEASPAARATPSAPPTRPPIA